MEEQKSEIMTKKSPRQSSKRRSSSLKRNKNEIEEIKADFVEVNNDGDEPAVESNLVKGAGTKSKKQTQAKRKPREGKKTKQVAISEFATNYSATDNEDKPKIKTKAQLKKEEREKIQAEKLLEKERN